VSENTYEVFEYIYGLVAQCDAPIDGLAGLADDHPGLVYHSHCQQRTLGLAAHTVAVLERLGYDVTETDIECCGMAGSFGYKTAYYEVSMDGGEQLREQPDADENRERVPARA
jgi:Fe-S oxidoreductase